MKTNLTRGKKLLYSFLLAGCFLTVMAVDDTPEQEERSQVHAEWIMQQAQKAEYERFYETKPEAINEPAVAEKPNWDKQFAMLRAEHDARKAK